MEDLSYGGTRRYSPLAGCLTLSGRGDEKKREETEKRVEEDWLIDDDVPERDISGLNTGGKLRDQLSKLSPCDSSATAGGHSGN